MPIINAPSFARRGVAALFVIATAVLVGCSDRGTDIPLVPGPGPGTGGSDEIPVLTALVPTRTVAGDTVRIAGTGFGAAQGTRSVLFPSSVDASVVATVLAWAADTVKVRVPDTAISGNVIVQVGDSTSNGLAFDLAPALVPYSLVSGLFTLRCNVCHAGGGGSFANFDTQSWGTLMAGTSTHGPVVRPRHGAASALVQKLKDPPPFGMRMPQFDPDPVSADTIQAIIDWIDQGARP